MLHLVRWKIQRNMASCLLENPKVIPLGEGGINLKVARESAPQVIKDFWLKTSKAAKPAKPARAAMGMNIDYQS